MSIVAFAEKNKAAAQIASILSEGDFERTTLEGVNVYEFKKDGKQWRVMGLSGHIMSYDYPQEYNNWKDVDPGVLIDTMPEQFITKQAFANAISRLAKDSDEIILACDYDREGENIGFEAKSISEKVCNSPIKRARFSSLSTGEIKKAFQNPLEPDVNLANSAKARQILDLKMGVAFTRYITLSVQQKARTKGVLSIGPCQTPTCGFVYEREKAIKDFEPRDFWKIEAVFNHNDIDFQGTHRSGKFFDKKKADTVHNNIKICKTGIITNKKVKETKSSPPYPLNTNEFLKRASKFLGLNSDRALEIAEQLYLSGFTSYPRTETNKYANDFDFKSRVAELTKKAHKELALEVFKKSEDGFNPRNGTKDAQDHPPIHPIKSANKGDINNAVNDSKGWDVYDLIVRHFLANLLQPAVFEKTRLEISVNDEIFDATGTVKKESGWMWAYPFEAKNDKILPEIEINEKLRINKITNTKSQTSPPKRLTESELLTLMDKNGIGTKATAPTHIETNKKRGYFETKGKSISILDTGFTLMEALDKSVPLIVKPEIRARVEQLIQDVEDGKKSLDGAINEGTALIKQMYSQLTSNKDEMVSQIAGTIYDESVVADSDNYIGKCSECNRVLRIVTTDNGRFVGCTGYPECKNTYPLPKKGALNIMKSRECKKGAPAVIKVGNKYHWAVGIGPCFKCDMENECFPPEIVGQCPNCDGYMFLIKTKDSRFLGCTNKCGYTQSVPKSGRLTILDNTCECGWYIVRVKEKEKEAKEFCVNRKCINKL
ncbi:DNA topoisomerase [Methanohalobium sp.]|uniref:DNA topoisomerase I n=1 Tax=Methanohalobium sp. TaxID=2837493 RepID=UPI0025DE62F2|nr:DNA topoisomerase [Methanohalobium sp.]